MKEGWRTSAEKLVVFTLKVWFSADLILRQIDLGW